jgi:hypothetical protein
VPAFRYATLRVNAAVWVLVLSGILGFRVGMIGYPEWQVAVETAQVIAGFVDYPVNNPFFIYHTKLWTSMHQILAVALLAGATEITLSLAVSGVMGMLTFQALAMFVYALSRDALLSIGAAALIFFSRSAEYGVVYPIFLVGTEHTYGAIGLSLSVLIAGLFGAGWYRTGAMLLGVAPCIHPSLGVWTGAIVACAVISDFRTLRRHLRPALPWLLAGCGVTLASLLIQATLIYDTPVGMARLSPADLSAFVTRWDGHRAAVDIWHNGVMLNVASAAVAITWLVMVRLKPDTTNASAVPRSSELLLRISAAGSLLAVALIPLSWIPPEQLPTALLVLMPGRYLNFGAMTVVALVIGLLASRRELWSRVTLLFVSLGLLVGDRSMLWEFLEHHHHVQYQSSIRPLSIIWIATLAVIAGAAWSRWQQGPPEGKDGPPKANHGPPKGGHYGWGFATYAIAIAMLGLVVLMTMHQHADRSGDHFADRTSDVFFGEVAAQSGVLLVAGDLHLIQLRTRRPVLVDSGALDTVMYSLETGAAMQEILREAYGLDLHNPPPEAIGAGRIPPQSHRASWEGYSLEKWREIRRRFGVTQVLTYADWRLELLPVSQSRRLLLYDIPDR